MTDLTDLKSLKCHPGHADAIAEDKRSKVKKIIKQVIIHYCYTYTDIQEKEITLARRTHGGDLVLFLKNCLNLSPEILFGSTLGFKANDSHILIMWVH